MTNDELVAALAAIVNRLGRAPTGDEYDRFSREVGIPGKQTVINRFGKWNTALEAAGLQTDKRRQYKRRWEPEECREVIYGLVQETRPVADR